MDPDKANTSIDIQVIDKMMDRWRLRLLTHGAASELGMEATRHSASWKPEKSTSTPRARAQQKPLP